MPADVQFQKVLTLIFTFGYFILVFTFVGLGAALFVSSPVAASVGITPTELPPGSSVVFAWMQGILGTLIGVLTGSVKDMVHFWIGSSKGSKDKDAAGVTARG